LVEPLRETGPHLAGIVAAHLSGDGPLYRQVAAALRRAVDAGEVPLGTVLPPERALASALAVSRSTVVSAYDRLKEDGWLESRQGSGTWVRRPDPTPDHGGTTTSATRLLFEEDEEAGGHAPTPTSDVIEFTVAAVRGASAVIETFRALGDGDLEAIVGSHGYVPGGLRPLRRAIAARFTERGVATGEDQVLVTTGAHQGIALIASQAVQPGDTVLVESPTFPGALDIFRSLGARLVPVPVDDQGARADVLADLIGRTSPRLIYLVPTYHNPTGAVMDATRRAEVARIAGESRVPVIEDLSLVDTGLTDDAPPAPIASHDSQAPVLTVGSMSKLFWAGLRVGWIRTQEAGIARLLKAKTVADLGTPMVDQLVAARLLARTDEVHAERRAELVPRLDTMITLLDELLPAWGWRRPPGGLSLWCQLPYGNAEEFAQVAMRHGVAAIPGPVLSVDEGNRRAVRLVFTQDEATIEAGVRRLATAWDAYAPTGAARPTSRLLV
jgi:DNA-binding transcriptional MocR family regulator